MSAKPLDPYAAQMAARVPVAEILMTGEWVKCVCDFDFVFTFFLGLIFSLLAYR